MDTVTIAVEDPRQPEIVRLVEDLDTYLLGLYPDDACYLLDIEALAAPGVRFLVARAGGTAVGCAALRIDPDGYGEVKRMYVAPAARGAGLGCRLLAHLTDLARDERLTALRLETGIRQPDAVALYRRAGFTTRGPFGGYPDVPESIFMERDL